MAGYRLPLEQVLLGLLMPGPAHGYELHRQAERWLGRAWYVGLSNVYNALDQLEQAGCVQCSLEPQPNRPPRKVFRITPSGQDRFVSWLCQPVGTIRDLRVEFMAKLCLLWRLSLPGADQLIAEQEAVCRKRLAQLEQALAETGEHEFDRLVLDFRRRQIEAILDWLQTLRDECGAWCVQSKEEG